jgi:hypothetical protein
MTPFIPSSARDNKTKQGRRLTENEEGKENNSLDCPHHRMILEYRIRDSEKCILPIERFLREEPYEQGALFNRPDHRGLYFNKECTGKTVGDGLEIPEVAE